MSAISIDVIIGTAARGKISKRWVSEVTLKTLRVVLGREHMLERGVNVSVVVTDDETVQSLNKQYRGEDKVTDVLSFSPNHWGHWYGLDESKPSPPEMEFVLPPGEVQPLGEIIISYQQASRQSSSEGNAVRAVRGEISHLIVHGLLHLLGYDHVQPDEETVMKNKEQEVLDGLL